MKAASVGTFVISWDQTEIDGLAGAPQEALRVGASWTWIGDAMRLDGPNSIFVLHSALGERELHACAAKTVRKLLGPVIRKPLRAVDETEPEIPYSATFSLTNGARRFEATVVSAGSHKAPLVLFLGAPPPRNEDLWVVEVNEPQRRSHRPAGAGGVLCFTPGTRLLAPDGIVPVEHLREGDWLQTKDNGPQRIEWIGMETFSGARLFASPRLRPVRIGANRLGVGRPDHDLLVSPEHRIVLRGAVAQSLFNEPEVLVMAKDLVNGRGIRRDLDVMQVTYIHVLMARHEVLFANGIETESFHPADADFSTLGRSERASLSDLFPGIVSDPYLYGEHARRALSRSEATLLLKDRA